MTLSDYLIIAGLACLLVAAIRYSVKKSKSGCSSCSGCSCCSAKGSCGKNEE